MHRAITAVVSIVFITGLFFAGSAANASSVGKVKGKQAIVVFDEGETPAAGDKFFAMENGKKKAILEVVQFKNGKAKVKILKGDAKEGMNVAVAKAGKKAKAQAAAGDEEAAADPDAEAPPEEDADDSKKKKKKSTRTAGAATLFKDMTLGGVAGYAMDSQSVKADGATLAMAGTGFSFKAFLDIPVTGSLGLLGRGGVEQFNVQSGDFKTELMYGVADLLLKYSFGEGNFVPFAMGGLGIHYPISKSSNRLNTSLVSSTTVFYGGAGINYVLSGSSYFQLTGEYGMFPPSNDVSTTLIAIRGGMGFRF